MKIEIELPDWVDKRVIQVLAGIERVAFKMPKDDRFKVKVSRCNRCGECCKRLNSNHVFPVINGQCIHLEKEVGKNNNWRCKFGIDRPYQCCVAKSRISECSEKYE